MSFLSMSNYIKKRRNIQKNGVFDGAMGAVAPQNAPYLTRINKSTATSVKFDVIIDQIDDILASDLRFIKSVRSWLIDNSKKVVYE